MFRIDLGRNQRGGVPGSSERVGVVRRTTWRNSKKVGQVHIVNATDASDQENLGVLVEPAALCGPVLVKIRSSHHSVY